MALAVNPQISTPYLQNLATALEPDLGMEEEELSSDTPAFDGGDPGQSLADEGDPGQTRCRSEEGSGQEAGNLPGPR